MKIDPSSIERDIADGTLRQNLETELTIGFREMSDGGEAIPPPSYYASRIAFIINDQLSEPLPSAVAFDLYQEILLACETARAAVLGEEPVKPS